jgi:hypothetical protein
MTSIGEAVRTALALIAMAPPAVAMARHLARDLRPTERMLVGLALAPATLALPALLLALAVRLPLGVAFALSEFVWIAFALWPAGPPTASRVRREPRPERGHGFPSLAAMAVVAAAATFTMAMPFAAPLLRFSPEAWFHAAAAIDLRLHGMPLHDPTFAGMPLGRPWLPSFWIALLHAGIGASPLHLQVALAAWAAAVWTLAGAHLAYRIFGRPAAAFAAAIAAFGFNAIGWLSWALRPAAGAGTMNKLMELAGTSAAPAALVPSGAAALDASLMLRFWESGERSLGLALAATLSWSVAGGLDRPATRSWSRTLILALTLFMWSPDTARPTVAALLGGWLLGALLGGRAGGIANPAALLLAALLAWPYLRACEIPGGKGALDWGWNAAHASSLAWGVGPWWLAAIPAALLALSLGAAGTLAVGAAATAAIAAVATGPPPFAADLALPIAWLWLAPLAAGGFVWWSDRLRLPWPARLAALAALVLPTLALLALGALSEGRSPGALVRPETPGGSALPLATPGEARAYWLLRDVLPKEAVIIEGPRAVANEPVPVLAERRLFFPPHGVDPYDGYRDRSTTLRARIALDEEFEVRRDLQRALFGSGELSEAQRVYLDVFPAPLYAIVRRAEFPPPVWDGLRDRAEWSDVLSNDEVQLYRYRVARR